MPRPGPPSCAHGRTVLRRLNRIEYQNTVRDLLGIDVDFQEMLPADSSANGFDNIGEAMHVSSFLMEKYLEAADTALSLAIANGPQPPVIKKRYSLKDQHQVKTTTENVYRIQDDTVALFSSSAWHAVHIYEFYPPDRGRYRFRISASAIQSSDKPVTYCVSVAGKRMAGTSGLIGYFDAPAEKPTVVEFVEFMEPRTTIHILPYGLPNAQTVHKIGADKYEGPGLAVQWVEMEGPLNDTWPPESHRRIFGDLEQKPSPVFNNSNRVEVVSNNPEADAERILRDFARRAFRRSVTDADVKPFVELVKKKLAAKQSFEQAVRVGLMAIMVSPDFLFLREKPGKLDDFALAIRLSYFLWSTMPDEELLTLAEKGKLSQPETLRRQVERMLKHPKAAAFTENFVGQWLGLREIDSTEPSHLLYPEFDHMLKVSMIRETELFFAEVLKDDLSLTNFVASDFTMLNGRLAKHYGIPGVDGLAFRKVTLPAGKPPRRRADDGERAEGDRQRHDHLAGHARGVGAGAHSGNAAAEAARRCAGDRAGHSRRHDDPRATRQTPADRFLCELPHQDRPAGLRPRELRRDRRLAREVSNHRRRGQERGDRGWPADALSHGSEGRSFGRDAGRVEVQEHRRVQATASEGQGSARPRPDREAADLRHRRCPGGDGRSRDRGDRRRKFARRITASGRWSMRSCRAGAFQTK